MRDAAPDQPPRLPPPLPPGVSPKLETQHPALSYFVPPPPVGWAVAGSFSASEWHAANRLLANRSITARMGSAVLGSSNVELLVPLSNAEYARFLLAKAIPSPQKQEKATGGFPMVPMGAEFAARLEPTEIPFADALPPRLTPRQLQNYNIFLVLLWLALIVVVILTVLACFIPNW